MRVTRLVAASALALAALTACGSPAPDAGDPAAAGSGEPTGPKVTGTYVFVEKNEQTVCDYLEADGKRYHLIYDRHVGHGVLTGGDNGAPLVSFIFLGEGDDGFTAGTDPAAYGARPDVIAVGERATGWGTLTPAAAQDPCQPYDQVLTLSVLRPA